VQWLQDRDSIQVYNAYESWKAVDAIITNFLDRIKNCKEVVAEMIAAFRKKKSQHIENILFAQLFGFLSRQLG